MDPFNIITQFNLQHEIFLQHMSMLNDCKRNIQETFICGVFCGCQDMRRTLRIGPICMQ